GGRLDTRGIGVNDFHVAPSTSRNERIVPSNMPTATSVANPRRQQQFRRATPPLAGTALSRPSTSLLDLRVLMVTITGFCVFLDVYATQTLLPLFTRLFNASKFEVSLTVSATTIGIAVGAPIVGLLAERIG